MKMHSNEDEDVIFRCVSITHTQMPTDFCSCPPMHIISTAMTFTCPKPPFYLEYIPIQRHANAFSNMFYRFNNIAFNAKVNFELFEM